MRSTACETGRLLSTPVVGPSRLGARFTNVCLGLADREVIPSPLATRECPTGTVRYRVWSTIPQCCDVVLMVDVWGRPCRARAAEQLPTVYARTHLNVRPSLLHTDTSPIPPSPHLRCAHSKVAQYVVGSAALTPPQPFTTNPLYCYPPLSDVTLCPRRRKV